MTDNIQTGGLFLLAGGALYWGTRTLGSEEDDEFTQTAMLLGSAALGLWGVKKIMEPPPFEEEEDIFALANPYDVEVEEIEEPEPGMNPLPVLLLVGGIFVVAWLSGEKETEGEKFLADAKAQTVWF